MGQVVHDSLAYLNDGDLHAIAIYLKGLPAIAEAASPRPSGEAGPHAAGEVVYLNRCASCHQPDGMGQPGRISPLVGNEIVTAKGPEDVIRQILEGHLATGSYAPMPAIGASMTDQEIADVTDYVRNAWSNGRRSSRKPDSSVRSGKDHQHPRGSRSDRRAQRPLHDRIRTFPAGAGDQRSADRPELGRHHPGDNAANNSRR